MHTHRSISRLAGLGRLDAALHAAHFGFRGFDAGVQAADFAAQVVHVGLGGQGLVAGFQHGGASRRCGERQRESQRMGAEEVFHDGAE